jgi:hypothetical protein
MVLGNDVGYAQYTEVLRDDWVGGLPGDSVKISPEDRPGVPDGPYFWEYGIRVEIQRAANRSCQVGHTGGLELAVRASLQPLQMPPGSSTGSASRFPGPPASRYALRGRKVLERHPARKDNVDQYQSLVFRSVKVDVVPRVVRDLVSEFQPLAATLQGRGREWRRRPGRRIRASPAAGGGTWCSAPRRSPGASKIAGLARHPDAVAHFRCG